MTDTDTKTAYDAGWQEIREAMKRLEPIHRARVSEVVRGYIPAATKLTIEATDQNHSGWVLRGVHTDEGPVDINDHALDHLNDDDGLWALLDDYGAWCPSEDNTSPRDFELDPVAT
jgi:hypothetical protein